MDTTLQSLTQQEIAALAVEASRRGDTAHALAYLKQAAARGDAAPEVLFLLGSEYAQIGLVADAKSYMQRAVAEAPEFAVARFQLGLLHLTSGEADAALAVWERLSMLDGAAAPGCYLQPFHRGLRHLIADEFEPAAALLEQGIALNTENPALNQDMQRFVDEMRRLATAPAAAASGDSKPAEPSTTAPDQKTESTLEMGSEAEPTSASHLFINAYTGGKPH